MTTQEKAKQLVDEFTDFGQAHTQFPINAAIICVDEIIDCLEHFGYIGVMYDDFETGRISCADEKSPVEYWREVKHELEKM